MSTLDQALHPYWAPVFRNGQVLGHLTCLIACIAFFNAARADAETLTLVDAMALAYETNPRLAEARAALQALDQNVAEANAGWRPKANASVSYGTNHGLFTGVPNHLDTLPLVGQVSVTEPIYRGGRTVAEIGRAREQVKAGRAQLLAAEQATLLAAVTAYMDVVRDTETLKSSQKYVASLSTELSDVRTELAAGEVTRTDASQAEARLQRARAEATNAQNRLAASRAAFISAIGRPAEGLSSTVPKPRIPATEDAALEIARRLNPDMVQVRANERAARYSVDDAEGALLPDVSVSAQYQYLNDAAGSSAFASNRQQQVMSLIGQINVPLYQGGAEDAAVRRAKDLHAQSDLAISSTESDLKQNLDNAWQQIQTSQESITANRAQLAADESVVDGIKQQQAAGERSVLDVLNAQQELFAAQVAVLVAEHDDVIAAYRLLSVTGQLTAQNLGLRVKIYDPGVHYRENSDAWFGLGE